MTLEKLTLVAQLVLNDLWSEQRIPFQLTAHKVQCLGMNEYVVRFYDSRLRSVDVSSKNYEAFRHALRAKVLARVGRLDGPKAQWLQPAGLLREIYLG